MPRLAALLLAACFALLGSGALGKLHGLTHASEAASEAVRLPSGGGSPCLPSGEEGDCALHLLLQSPLAAADDEVVVQDASVACGSVTPRSTVLRGSRQPARVDCRGPPCC